MSDDQDHVYIEASKKGDYFNLKTRTDPEQFFETKFNSQGDPINPSTFTVSEVYDIVNFINNLPHEQNFIGLTLPESTYSFPLIE